MIRVLAAMAAILLLGGCCLSLDVRFVQEPGVVEREKITRTSTVREGGGKPVVLEKVDPCDACTEQIRRESREGK